MDDIKRLLTYERDEEACILIDSYVKGGWDDQQLSKLSSAVLDHCRDDVHQHLIELRPDLIHVVADNGECVIHYASRYRPERVPRLIELGADVNDHTERGKTPLDYAYGFRNTETIRFLLEHGASTFLGWMRWLRDHDLERDYIGRKWLRRAHYLALLPRIPGMPADAVRMLVEMLA